MPYFCDKSYMKMKDEKRSRGPSARIRPVGRKANFCKEMKMMTAKSENDDNKG